MDTIGSIPADFIRGGISMTFDLEALGQVSHI
jgi:hypothetical protein